MGNEIEKKIEAEVGDLKQKLQDRLKQTEELGDLERGLEKQTFGLEKTTEEHQSVSRETRNKMWWKYAKWVAIIVIIIGLLAMIFLRPLFQFTFTFLIQFRPYYTIMQYQSTFYNLNVPIFYSPMDNKFFSVVHRKLKKIPLIGADVSHVDLRRNEITKMDFTLNTKIEYLDLSDNNIKIMENLDKFPNLRILDLSYNLFDKINLPRFNLKELYLICNDIEKIENIDLDEIIKLDLAVNNIVVIKNLSNCTTLRELYLGSNRIRETGDLKYLRSLRVLDLQNNKLTKVDCSELPDSLESLLLSDNKDLVEIKNLECLTNLKLLAIERTKIENVRSYGILELWK